MGGYYRSEIEDLLPVSMEQRKEHRKLSSAIVVAIDRSGSMGAPIGGNRVKLDLANLGTAELIRSLSPFDEIGVIAMNTGPHEVISLGPNSDPDTFAARVLRIEVNGGGINIYPALTRMLQMLQHSQSNTRHMILFADAAHTEEPGQYRQLLAKAREAGITCSVIGMGTVNDAYVELLKDIALHGGGNCYFSNDPSELPRLFTQDAFVMARQTFIEEETPFRFTGGMATLTGGMATLTGQAYAQAPDMGGYNLCYTRPQALVSAMTTDEYNSPVIASWQRGLGRVLAYTGQVDGKYTGPLAGWDRYATMLASLARWTMGGGEQLPDNMLLTQEVRDGGCIVRLHLDPEREQASLDASPRVIAIKQLGAIMLEPETVEMHWVDPDTLEAVLPLTGEETLVATLSLQDRADTSPVTPVLRPVALPPVCLPYSPEFRPVEPGQGRDALAQLAEITQGQERIDISQIWGSLQRVPRSFDLAKWLLFAGMVCFLIEILQRRTGLVVVLWNRLQASGFRLRDRLWGKLQTSGIRSRYSRSPKPEARSPETDTVTDETTDGSKKLSWWSRRRISREQDAALLIAKKRTTDRTDEGDGRIINQPPPVEQASKPQRADTEQESMFDALARARRAAKDRTKE